MDAETLENWRKIKKALEAAGKTDCDYYVRAVAILRGQPDPWNPLDKMTLLNRSRGSVLDTTGHSSDHRWR